MALVAALVIAAPAIPAAAQQAPNLVRSGPNLTLVVASCPGPADNAVAEALAAHSRNAAKVCVDPSGLSPQTAAVIADFAPDRVLVVGGEVAVPPAVMDELTEVARAAYRWTVIERIGGASRIETAAAAARVALEHPDVVGPDTATLIVADGWNGTDVRTAADVASQTEDAALAYVSPRTIADGMPAATAALIAEYRPARVVIVGLPDGAPGATEAAIATTLGAAGLTIEIERVAEAGEPVFTIPEASPSDQSAREIFTAIVDGTHQRGFPEAGTLPVLAASTARGPLGGGVGARLWTVRADGSGRELRSEEHRGWSWNPGDGQLSWTNLDGRLRIAAPGSDEQVLFETGGYPSWSPDGSHVVTLRFGGFPAQGRRNSIEAHLGSADGGPPQQLGFVDYRTFLFSDLPLASWSPDSKRFAYIAQSFDVASGTTALHARIETVDGSAPTVTLGEDITFLGWSPDGSHVAYATPSDCDGNGRDESQNLWIARFDGSDARDLGFIDRIQWRFLHLWSPDGAHLAYESLDPADCSMHLRVATANGEPTALKPVTGGRLVGWSPNGTHLAYGITVGTAGKGVPLREHAWVVRHDGSDRHELGEARPSVFGPVLWSADGNHLAYTETLRDDGGDVIGARPVTERTDGIGRPVLLAERGNIVGWSPVDQRLAYVSHHDEYGDDAVDRRSLAVHTAGSPGADTTLVYELADVTLGGRWSPDGDYLGYVSGPTELLLDWFINRRRGSDAWVVATSEPRFTYRVVTDVTWGEWQPR